MYSNRELIILQDQGAAENGLTIRQLWAFKTEKAGNISKGKSK